MFRKYGEWRDINPDIKGSPPRRDVAYDISAGARSMVSNISVEQYSGYPSFRYVIQIKFDEAADTSQFSYFNAQPFNTYFKGRVCLEPKEEFLAVGYMLDTLMKHYNLPSRIACELQVDLELHNTQEAIIEDLTSHLMKDNYEFFVSKLKGYHEAITDDQEHKYHTDISLDEITMHCGELAEKKYGLSEAMKTYALISNPETAYHMASRLFDDTFEFDVDIQRFEYGLKLAMTSKDEILINKIFHLLCEPAETSGLDKVFPFAIDSSFTHVQLLKIAGALRAKNEIIFAQQKKIHSLEGGSNTNSQSARGVASSISFGGAIRSGSAASASQSGSDETKMIDEDSHKPRPLD